MKFLKPLLLLLVVGVLGAIGFIYSGAYPIGADDAHTKPVYMALETLRERSIAVRSGDISVPALDDSQMLLSGGADYNDMCASCHLKPGKTESDMSIGLYPKPPNLAMPADMHGEGQDEHDHGDEKASAARQFWIIKHGLKMTAMPAWGATHDDQRIWAMVAFLQKLPSLTPEQYQILTARGKGDSGMDHADAAPAAAPPLGGDAHGGHGGMDMSQMPMSEAGSAAPDAEKAVEAFRSALRVGDRAVLSYWLTDDLLVYEGGGAERSRDEFLALHAGADAAFLKASKVDLLKRVSGSSGDSAWVNSEYRIRGQSSKGRPIDVLNTETILLRKTPQGWRVQHVHWSSQDYAAVAAPSA
jgi:ketosteroid isomerase-like protein